MATTKKNVDDLDYTNQPQATTAEDVNNQDARTRLWQSLSYGYNNQIKQSNKAYDQAYSQADRQALSRGMQRSSYNSQNLANINQQKIEAQNNINSALIADYQNRIGDIENQEKEDERWERQFAETQRQNDWSRNFQQSQFDYGKEQDALNRAFQEQQYADQQAQWREEFDYNKMSDSQKLAYNYIAAAAANGGDVSDDLLKQAGISRQDYNAMKAQATSGGGGGGWRSGAGGGTEEDTNTNPETGNSEGAMEDELRGYARKPLTVESVGVAQTGQGTSNAPADYDLWRAQVLASTKNDYIDQQQKKNKKK